MIDCPECQCVLNQYVDNGFIITICWSCGHYDSSSPAYKVHPEFYKNIVRENPQAFMRRFLKLKIADVILQKKTTDTDLTEPLQGFWFVSGDELTFSPCYKSGDFEVLYTIE